MTRLRDEKKPSGSIVSSSTDNGKGVDDLAFAQDFVARVPWRFAITMQYVPHSYTVRGQSPDAEFEAFVRLIRSHGQPAKYGSFVTTYLKLGQHKYWTMGEPVEDITIINRRHEDDEFGEVRDISGAEIEERRGHWEALDLQGKAHWWREALKRG